MKRFIAAILVVLLFSGCTTQTFVVNSGGGEVATLDQSQPFSSGVSVKAARLMLLAFVAVPAKLPKSKRNRAL